MQESAQDREFHEEAERLAQLPISEQEAILSLHMASAANTKAPRREREFARQRVAALTRHLRRLRRGKKS